MTAMTLSHPPWIGRRMMASSEFLRPWKLATLAAGTLVLIAGAHIEQAPDWDVPVSLIMALFAYLLAPWCMRVLVTRRYRQWPLMILATWWGVDGCYALYWSWRNPAALEAMREANAPASLCLFSACGLLWYWRGSLDEAAAGLRDWLVRWTRN